MTTNAYKLELGKLLSRSGSGRLVILPLDLEHIEADGFGEGTAFSDSHNITRLDSNKARRAMRS